MSPAHKGLCHLGLGAGQTWLPVSDRLSGNPPTGSGRSFAPPTLLGLTNQEQADVRLGAPEQGMGLRPCRRHSSLSGHSQIHVAGTVRSLRGPLGCSEP